MATKKIPLRHAIAARRHARVLLAEDDAEVRRLLSLALTRAGFDLVQASSGDEALERIADQLLEDADAFDLVIADVRLPGCTGLDLLACLRHFDWHTPVILLTAFRNAAAQDEARQLGAFAVFHKPFDLDELELAVFSATPHFMH
jgi:DNA-binding response OmpR family regulator